MEIEVEMFHLNTTPPIKDHNAKSVESSVTPPFNAITGLIMPTKAIPLIWRLIWHLPLHNLTLNGYPDTGSTNHLTNDLSNLSVHSEPYLGNDQIHVDDGAGLSIKNIGSATLSTPANSFTLNKLLHVPHIQKNLISVSQFTSDNNVYLEFHSSSFLVKDEATGRILLRGKPKDGLYIFPTSISPTNHPQTYLSQRAPLDVWHCRMGHPSYQTVRHLVSKFSLPTSSNKIPSICSACQQGKSHRLLFSSSQSISTHPFELIFSDVWGPSPIMSTNGNKYYVSFIDHFSKYTWLFPIPAKSSVMQIFCSFQKLVERQFNCKIKSIQTDWGGEYRSLHTYFANIGIRHRITCPHTSQQNGSVERKHRHIIETGLSLLSHSHVPHIYWDDAFLMAHISLIAFLPPLLAFHHWKNYTTILLISHL